ncbi:hypothetical protein [Streptomyces sp. NPDC058614]|uniref:hypothetical protein n=1 Tax=Streptomyces sp. NPDC058614 TaxID=3346557 RepID=UPI00365D1B32
MTIMTIHEHKHGKAATTDVAHANKVRALNAARPPKALKDQYNQAASSRVLIVNGFARR